MPGVLAVTLKPFSSYDHASREISEFELLFKDIGGTMKDRVAMIIVADEGGEVAASLNNFLWISFTRTNPSHDVYGVNETIQFKHWGCTGPVILDARIKPFHAPLLQKDPEVENRINKLFLPGGSLQGRI